MTDKKPHQTLLELDSLAELSAGQAGAIINAAIQAAVRDTEDRGADKKPRKVSIELVFKKLGDDNVTMSVKAIPKLPPYQTEETVGAIVLEVGKPKVAFSAGAPHNPQQTTITE